MAIDKGKNLPSVAANAPDGATQGGVTDSIATKEGRQARLNQLSAIVGFDISKIPTQPGDAKGKELSKHQNMFNHIKALKLFIDTL